MNKDDCRQLWHELENYRQGFAAGHKAATDSVLKHLSKLSDDVRETCGPEYKFLIRRIKAISDELQETK